MQLVRDDVYAEMGAPRDPAATEPPSSSGPGAVENVVRNRKMGLNFVPRGKVLVIGCAVDNQTSGKVPPKRRGLPAMTLTPLRTFSTLSNSGFDSGLR